MTVNWKEILWLTTVQIMYTPGFSLSTVFAVVDMFTCQLAICDLCKQKLPHNHSAYKCCAEPLTGGIDGMCGKCLKKTPQYNRILSPLLYHHRLVPLLHVLNIILNLAAGHVLRQLLVNYLRNQSLQDHSTPCPECIIPVPLHSSRLRQRGFNQSLEVSRLLGNSCLSRYYVIPVFGIGQLTLKVA